MKSEEGHDMRQNAKSRHHFLTGLAGTAITVAIASAFLATHTTSALADAAAQPGAPGCVMCHGMRGEGAPSGVPRLAGQNADYLDHALSLFKTGARAGAIMQPIAQNLSDSEIRRLADYFSNQHAALTDASASASSQLVIAGKQLAEMGTADKAACFSCHGAQGKGNGARFPSIAGQPAQFVINRLHEFQARAQGTAPQPGTMTAVAATLDERQIEEAAAYLSQLEP
jgi:cytochrome c553